jgi:hypothetical protein
MTKALKRKRTPKAQANDSDDDAKRRGRPRVEKQDESAADVSMPCCLCNYPLFEQEPSMDPLESMIIPMLQGLYGYFMVAPPRIVLDSP